MSYSLSIKQRLIALPLILVFSAVAIISTISLTALSEIAYLMRGKEMANNTRFIADTFSAMSTNLLEISEIIARNGNLTEGIYYYVKFGGERESINLVLKEIYERKPTDLMIVTDTDGLGLAYNNDIGRFNFKVSPELLGATLEDKKSSSIIKPVDGQLMIVSSIPIYHYIDTKTTDFVGVLIIGNTIDDGFLNTLKGATNLELASHHDGTIKATTSPLLNNYKISPQSAQIISNGDAVIDHHEPMPGIRMDLSYLPINSQGDDSRTVGSIIIAVRSEYIAKIQKSTTMKIIGLSFAVVVGIGVIGWRTGRGILSKIIELVEVSQELAKGNMSTRIKNPSSDEIGQLGQVFNHTIIFMEEQNWLRERTAECSAMVQRATSTSELAQSIISSLTPTLNGGLGLFFIFDPVSELYTLQGSYCRHQQQKSSFAVGESLIGQCALENKIIKLTQIPPEYVKINSALGDGTPQEILLIPIGVREQVVAVIEIASFQTFRQLSNVLLDEIRPIIGLGLENLLRNQHKEI